MLDDPLTSRPPAAAADCADQAQDAEAVAIIGMACRVPGARDVAGFWQNLVEGVDPIVRGQAQGNRPPGYVEAAGRIQDPGGFDADFFGVTPREAARTDPQQRLFLEQCWVALEHAAVDSARFDGRIGIWGGVGFNSYLLLNLVPHLNAADVLSEFAGELVHGNDKDYLASRVAYRLGLTGPAVTVQTACSTSLVAVANACQSLLEYQCDMALAGGAAVKLPLDYGYVYETGGIQSRDGYCRPFDAEASGTVFTSGVGVVVLKRLSEALADGDRIHAVIRGSAVNNDGARRAGYAAPSVAGQSEVIADALAVAGVDPADIGYVEAHGTGTAVGDPIELAALDEVFGPAEGPDDSVLIGSVKSNLGHLGAAAGVISLIKTALVLREGRVPATLHFRSPNPRFAPDSRFTVAAAATGWPRPGTRLAGVSSFGVGGTNAHVVLEQAPEPSAPAGRETRPEELVLLSAKNDQALADMRARLVESLSEPDGAALASVGHTLRHGRRQFDHRIAVVGPTRESVAQALAAAPTSRVADRRDLAFCFPGQGSQYSGMAADLLRAEPVFAEAFDACAEIVNPLLGRDLRELLTQRCAADQPDPLVATELAQPALFVVEYALAQWLRHLGVNPTAMIGHSIGEWVAATLAGVFDLPDALRLVAARGRLVAQQPAGSMLAVELGPDEARELERGTISVAAVNAPDRCVLSGASEEIAALAGQLAARGVEVRPLGTSHAFHSASMEPVVGPFTELVAQVTRHAPTIPFVSNVTGDWITDADATDPAYWARQLRRPVRFADGVAALFAAGDPVLVEVGPGASLGRFARRTAGPTADVVSCVPGLRDRTPGDRTLLRAVAELWRLGAPVDWSAFDAGARPGVAELPGYAFQPQQHWIHPPAQTTAAVSGSPAWQNTKAETAATQTAAEPPTGPAAPDQAGDPATELLVQIWQDLLGLPGIAVDDDLYRLGGDSMLATKLVARANQVFEVELDFESVLLTPTIRHMALLVAQAGPTQESREVVYQ